MRYASINRNLYTSGEFYPSDAELYTNAAQEFKNYFKGAGPRIGVQGRYGRQGSSGWGIDGNVNIAALIAQIDGYYKSNLIPISTIEGFIYQSSNCEHKTSVIPVLEAKLGIDYTYFNCKCNSSLVFEAGYQATSYFNAITNPIFDIGSVDTDFVGSRLSNTNTITVSGPYLGIRYYA